jgi:hypothetical protein
LAAGVGFDLQISIFAPDLRRRRAGGKYHHSQAPKLISGSVSTGQRVTFASARGNLGLNPFSNPGLLPMWGWHYLWAGLCTYLGWAVHLPGLGCALTVAVFRGRRDPISATASLRRTERPKRMSEAISQILNPHRQVANCV